MNATSRTLVFGGIALLSALAAFGAWSFSQPAVIEGYSEVGSEFFPDFKDPLSATALSVSVYDKDQGEAIAFAVKQDDNKRWIIPSHHNYPAEAKERLARTAASLIGLTRNAVQSRSEDDWKNYGVVAPDSDGSAKADERGTRVTLRDSSGNALVDLIIGKKVKGREKHYYVREPEKRTTYIAEMDVNLSAKFGDWIEPDLLKVSQNEIVRLTVDNYSVDEQRRALVQGDVLPFLKDGLKSTGKWTLEGLDAEKEKVDESVVNEIAQNIDQLKIVGVRPKPEGLGADLTVSDEIKSNPLIRQVLESEMRRQGFFVAVANGEEKLVSNEGEILAGTENGVKYTLYFGEIASGSSKDVEVGLAEKAEASEEKTETGEPKEETPAKETPAGEDAKGPRRYMLVKVEFDESLLGPEPQAPVEPAMPEILKESTAPAEATPAPAEATPAPDAATPGTPSNECGPQEQEPAPEQQPTEPPATEQPAAEQPAAQEAAAQEAAPQEPASAPAAQEAAPAQDAVPAQPPVDPKVAAKAEYDRAMAEYSRAKSAYESDKADRTRRIDEGKKKAEALGKRFASWYYVIEASSFEKFRVQRKDVVSLKTEADNAPAIPGGAPNFPGFNP